MASKRSSNKQSILLILVLLVAGYVYYCEPVKDAKPPKKQQPKEANKENKPSTPRKHKTTKPHGEEPDNSNTFPTSSTAVNFTFENAEDFAWPTHSTKDQVIKHKGYALCYVEKYEQASWVAYRLNGSNTRGGAEREDDFRPDPLVETGSALPEDYRGSGYDRGHIAAAADFKYSPNLMSESFYMSNMSPQAPDFNRGIWRELEEEVRFWSKKNKYLYVVSGPVLKGKLPTIGKKNQIAVPKMYYKVIIDLVKPETRAIAFLMKNEGSTEPFRNFAVSIDEVEKVTGLDFFPQLPDEMETKLESSTDFSSWFSK